MTIQWFPGHMHLTRKAIAERVSQIDVVIEMLDARLPGSSANPLLAELTAGRPSLKVLSKQDMADPVQTEAWLAHYGALPDTRAIAVDASMAAPAAVLVKACHALAPNRGGLVKPMRVLICGIPNVGKSTLINSMTGRRAAKAADEAGVTRQEQRTMLADDFYLFDTPGILWPRISVERSGINLAASGAVGRNAFDEELVALEVLGYMKTHYPLGLEARFKLGLAAADMAALSDEALLDRVGRKRGGMLGGGKVNVQKAAEVVLTELRTGGLGRVTLETPLEFAGWRVTGQLADAERELRKKAQRGAKKKPPQRGAVADEAKP
jgi:ribosome biogenesis GTPase A